MAKVKYDSVLLELKSRKRSIKRSELIEMLRGLGFNVRPGSKGTHYTFTHPAFVLHPGGTFNGEHGKDPLIKFTYIDDAVKILSKFGDELREFLGEKK